MSIGRLGLIQAGQPAKQCPTLAEMTADATATAAQIDKGATAYVKGQKITGTYEPEPCPTLAEMTADATATASDIVEGKTAYARGEKLTCTLVPVTKIDVAAARIKFGYSIFEDVPEICDFSNVTDAQNMFYSCKSLTSISGIEFSSVTFATNMFFDCSSLTSISGIEFSSVTNAQNMFYSCTSLTSISVIGFTSVTNAQSMFSNCISLTSISGIDFSSVTNAQNMFYNCIYLTNFYNTTEISCSLSFSNSSKLSIIDAETNIISYLADLTGKTSQTITFNTALEGQIGDSYIQEATSKNWVVSFAN